MLKQLERHLTEKIIPFWKKLMDPEQGGFYGAVDSRTLSVFKQADKGLVQQARILYSFSALENHFQTGEYLPFMTSVYHYLRNRMKDKENQGYFWLSKYQGLIADDRKITYGQGFLIYGMSEYYRATGDANALNEALETYRIIESRAKDPDTGGYWEEFDTHWNKSECLILGDGVLNTVYTLNTTLHLLEAYMNLYVVSKRQDVRASVIRLIGFIKNHLFDADRKTLYPYLDKSLEPINDTVSFGHNIETSWLLSEACERIGYLDEAACEITRILASEVLEDGFDGHYVHNHLIENVRDKTMVWWVQSEAMIGFYNQYQKTGDDAFRVAVEYIWEKITSCLVDKRENGEWFWSCDEAGRPNLDRGTAELWKTPYHNSRAMLELIERMSHHAHSPEIYQTIKEADVASQSKKQN